MRTIKTRSIHTYAFLSGVICVGFCLLLLLATPDIAQEKGSQDLLSQADAILQQMSELTGLPIRSPVKKQVVSRPEVEKYLIQNLHTEMTPAELHAQEALVRALGLVSQDFDLEKFVISFYTEQAAGFYDPSRKTMFIADWIPAEMQTMALSHELTHALQDQSWDLGHFLHSVRDNDDATAARLAVVEGHATAAMMQEATGALNLGQVPSLASLMESVLQEQFGDFPALAQAPYFIRMQAFFPYLQGLGFIQAGLQHGGWRDLGALFEHPPESTHEIFEPQSYFQHEVIPSIALAHPSALEGLPSLHFLAENVMGELGYYSLIGQLVSDDEAKQLGPSWRGDRYLLYEHPGGDDYALVARVRWSNGEASQSFFRDYHTILTHKYPELTSDSRSSSDVFVGTAANRVCLLLRNGDECLWAEGLPPARTDAMLAWLRGL
jgi:hypothetical protein